MLFAIISLPLTSLSVAGAHVNPPAPASVAATAPDASTDPFVWLEDVNGTRASAWVKDENAKTLDVLQKDPRFAGFYADAVKVGEAKDRIPGPQFIRGRIYNFWQDTDHVRGIWRSTSLSDYANPEPNWQTVLDLDALAKAEGKNWFWRGANCDAPSRTRCLILLSEGGEDAVTIREFDLSRGQFVADGFTLSRGKQTAAWASDDALFVSREWEPGELTASGYPYIVKRVQRGQPLSAALEVMRGTKSDVSVNPFAISDGRGHRAMFVSRGLTTFEEETQILTQSGLRKLAIPLKASVGQLVAGRLIIELDDAWQANGTSFPAGALVSVDLAAATQAPDALKPTLIYAPGPRETVGGEVATSDRLVVANYDNVRGRAAIYAPASNGAWTRTPLDVPDNLSVNIGSGDKTGPYAFLSLSGFLTPTSLMLVDADSGSLKTIKAEPPRFDASNLSVAQHFATSSDGTKIPYFIVGPKNMKLDGSNPTILYAYGGFSISLTPNYSAQLGKLWLERGGVYVLANIRGGGEFGPAWHEAGLKTHRQLIYDDFASVARDLISSGVTSPRHLGIEGGSNGGLLMGVEFTQHPELWNAVDIEVPLLDMLRYEQIQAGASWVGEYGSVSNPDERAFLASISPYNNLKAGVKYPEPFVWTTTKDDRVGPQHARKFAAKLSALGDPYLFYEVTEGGHGAGANIRERAFTEALAMTYFSQKLMP
jgi:prolyl oligopeptidase